MTGAPLFVLVHSPLVGPLTWASTAGALANQGVPAIVPALDTGGTGEPYWRQHVASVTAAINRMPDAADANMVLVGHSGAGVLLPAIAHSLARPPAAYIFVDADIPRDGKSRLSLREPADAHQVREAAAGGMIPPWTADDLSGVIPAALMSEFVAELAPLPLAVYEEPLPVFTGWPDAPCGYISFSPSDLSPYAKTIRYVQQEGWLYQEVAGNHFEMLHNPTSVASMLVTMAEELPDPGEKE